MLERRDVLADQLRIGALLPAIVSSERYTSGSLVPVSIFTKVHVDSGRGTNSFSFAEKLMLLFGR
jgi:hypothetical protein